MSRVLRQASQAAVPTSEQRSTVPVPIAHPAGTFVAPAASVAHHWGHPDAGPWAVETIRSLQRTAGNAVVTSLLWYDLHRARDRATNAVSLNRSPVMGTSGPLALSVIPVQRAITSPRLKGDAVLAAVEAGTHSLDLNSTGRAVVRVKQALMDLGAGVTANDTYDEPTALAVIECQDEDAALTDGVGIVGQKTLRRLDLAFATRAPERLRATGYDPSDQDAGTRLLGAGDRAEVINLLQPPTVAVAPGGAPAAFRDQTGNPRKSYKERLKEKVNAKVSSQHSKADAKREARDERRITPWHHIENLALVAKQCTDAVFGRYQTGPAFTQGVNLRDRWERQEQMITGTNPAGKQRIAEKRVQKILDSAPEIREVNRLHRAVVGRQPETTTMAQVKNEVATARCAHLLTIQKGWPASNQPGTGVVSIQRVRSEEAVTNRRTSWELMQTLIHEYIHTLTHGSYRQYQATLGNSEKVHTLKEGVTELLTRIVVSGLDHDALRAQVEGDDYDAGNPIAIPTRAGKYQDAADRAEQIAGVVGIANVYAAYFLGRTDLIGRV